MSRTYASIYTHGGELVTEGLNTCESSDQAIKVARAIAEERGESVILEDSDGLWCVADTGDATKTTWGEVQP